jgi:hypothetical protein
VKRTFGIFLSLLLSACASIAPTRPPLLSPFGDGTQWIVWEDIEFRVELNDKSTTTILVPRGFVTDLASTPPEIWSIYPPFGKYLSASILHDYLYWRQSCPRDEADKIFYQTMRDAGVDQATQSRFFMALKKKGGDAWKQNDLDRSRGLVRVIPGRFLDPSSDLIGTNSVWSEIRESLRKRGAVEPPQASDRDIPKACGALGREIEVKSGFGNAVFGK